MKVFYLKNKLVYINNYNGYKVILKYSYRKKKSLTIYCDGDVFFYDLSSYDDGVKWSKMVETIVSNGALGYFGHTNREKLSAIIGALLEFVLVFS